MSEEEKEIIVQKALLPFKREGVTKLSKGNINLPLKYEGLPTIEYTIKDSIKAKEDHFSGIEGECMEGVIIMTAHKVGIKIVFKELVIAEEDGPTHIYKILH